MAKKKTFSISTKMNKKSDEIINQLTETSYEAKRIEMMNYLDDYYSKFNGPSDALIERLNDINFFSSTSKDLEASLLIGVISSAMITMLFEITKLNNGENTQSDFLLNLFISVIISALVTLVVIIAFKFIYDVFQSRKKLSSYEILHISDYEKQLIEDILNYRLKKEKFKPIKVKVKKL